MNKQRHFLKTGQSWTSNVRTKTLLYFLLFSGVLLAVLWLAQVVFLNTFYEMIKQSQVKKLTNEIVEHYDSENYRYYLANIAYQNELRVLVFHVEGNTIVIEASGGVSTVGVGPESLSITQELNRFIGELQNKTSVSYSEETLSNRTMTYGQARKVNGNQVYFYVNSTIVPIDSTTSALTYQLIIVSILSLFMSVFLSLIMSKQLSEPIVRLTDTAEQMAQGKLDVKFEGEGFNEVEKLANTLNFATAELQKTETFRRDLLANVSHELRTPLTMITAYAEMIQDISGDNRDKRNAHLSVIIEESERLRVLVNDILDLSKLQAGVVEYHLFSFNLSQSVERILQTFRGSYTKDSYTFESDIAPDISVVADEKRIEQVVYNLIANAVNYAGEDKKIIVRLAREERGNVLYVQDHGEGISPEDIDTIFDRFFRADKTKRTKKGSGIGLSIVKSVLVAHNFKYGVDSTVGVGSTFYVVFPENEAQQ